MILQPLLPVKGPLFCGPGVIAAFTGFHPHKEVREAINYLRDNPPDTPVEGMTCGEVKAVLEAMGVPCGAVLRGCGETLRTFVESHPGFVGVVNVTGHFVAVSHGWCLDNGSEVDVPVAKFKGNRALVRNIIEVEF